MPAQFYELSPAEFNEGLHEWNEIYESQQRFELEKMRLQTLYLVNVQLDKNNRFNDARKFMPFAWDHIEVFVPTKEDWEHFDKLVKSWQAKPSTN